MRSRRRCARASKSAERENGRKKEKRQERENDGRPKTHHAVTLAARLVRCVDRANDLAREVNAVVARGEAEAEHFKDPRELLAVDRARSILVDALEEMIDLPLQLPEPRDE